MDPRVIQLLESYKIPYADRNPKESWQWDGETLAIQNKPENVLHDAAHWLVASENLRKLPDFGLGAGNESGRPADCVVQDDSHDEIRASLLGIIFEFALGYDWIGTLDEHCWLDTAYKDAAWEHNKDLRYMTEPHAKDLREFIKVYRSQGVFRHKVLWGVKFESTPVIRSLMKTRKDYGIALNQLHELDKERINGELVRGLQRRACQAA